MYGGKKRPITKLAGSVDDITVEQVRKHWEYLDEQAAREAQAAPPPKPRPHEPAKVAAAATAAPLPASIKVTNPKGQIVTAHDMAAMAQDLARQRIEIDLAVTRARRAADDALILSLLND